MKHPYLQTGKIVSTHGVHGEVKLLPWADSPEFLLQFHTLYLDGRPYQVEQSRVQKTCVLLKLEGIDTVEAASALRDKIVSIARADAKLPEGSLFIADLLGLPVYDGETLLGTLAEVMPTRCKVRGRAGASDPLRAGFRARTQSGRGLYQSPPHRRDVTPCALIS